MILYPITLFLNPNPQTHYLPFYIISLLFPNPNLINLLLFFQPPTQTQPHLLSPDPAATPSMTEPTSPLCARLLGTTVTPLMVPHHLELRRSREHLPGCPFPMAHAQPGPKAAQPCLVVVPPHARAAAPNSRDSSLLLPHAQAQQAELPPAAVHTSTAQHPNLHDQHKAARTPLQQLLCPLRRALQPPPTPARAPHWQHIQPCALSLPCLVG